MAPAANPRPKGSSGSKNHMRPAANGAAIGCGTLVNSAQPMHCQIDRPFARRARVMAIASGTLWTASAETTATPKPCSPEPKATPIAMPSGSECAVIAATIISAAVPPVARKLNGSKPSAARTHLAMPA